MAVESEAAEYDSIFTLMEKYDEDEDDDDDGAVKGSNQRWYMDSGRSKHMTGSTDDFLSIKALQGGSVSFDNGKKGYILRETKLNSYQRLSLSPVLMTGEVVLMAKRFKNIYLADFEYLNNGDLTCLSVFVDDAELWHKILGHASFSLLNKLVKKDLVHGLPKSRFKDQKIQVKMSHNIVNIRSDHGTKFENAKFIKFYAEIGISLNFLARRTPLQNSVVERKNRTLENMARTILIDSGVAKGFWAEAINTTCYLINRCIIRSLLNKTPYELLNERKPKLTYMRTFGCKWFALNNGKEVLEKFDAKSDKRIFLGYSPQSKAYKVYKKGLYVLNKAYKVYKKGLYVLKKAYM
ncbi:uncharacterized protein LOC142163132 [Nicotiana tabacum]|uniref:Uncharacterized protein LOC142163132 n=1 Tax=Nicotiana tabacum TaxID=4097 RepID=A0AC58RUT8_TOBAC